MHLFSENSILIKNIAGFEGETVELQGWVMNRRSGKGIVFVILRDGSGFIQCVGTQSDIGDEKFNLLESLGLESSLWLKGKVVRDDRQIGGYEVHIQDVKVYQNVSDYPITKKEHGVEFLMDNRHLWLRSKRQWAAMRVRNQVIFSIHRFFQERGFVQMDSPIFTGNAVEGTSTLFETEFFDKPAYLSQSGQLYGEAMAMAQGLIYTFGPTFRAEKSKTRRHLSEFWMIEPEMAFYDLKKNMDLIEDFIRFLVVNVLENCRFELEVLERDLTYLKNVLNPFERITYDEAVKILKGEKSVNGKNSIELLKNDLEQAKQRMKDIEAEIEDKEKLVKAGGLKKGAMAFNEEKIRLLKVELKELQELERNIPQWLESAANFEYGNDFGGSDETVLTRIFDVPVMVYNWPKECKAFYMKEVEDNPCLVKGVDVLAPEGYGEIVGGGERETDINKLISSIEHHKLPMSAFEWYLDLRRFGSVPHAGFGLGLERFVSWMCKLQHVRESIPFPRMMGTLFP
ncbi:MAG TPA: asparagine--tRNA ligase [Bacteroidia bacterium]|nr:asparagine--tRNA ligase [Sphingobacteriales bacterium]HPD65075.1 asparagine--tRNA ligase [Bacteroidia bacterium]HRS58764.1 asparagine--tRNA ligase [Bacteroidia bacterium]HRU67902.1 asparagine--tRNA ligase [Bacteroidia bacterium]